VNGAISAQRRRTSEEESISNLTLFSGGAPLTVQHHAQASERHPVTRSRFQNFAVDWPCARTSRGERQVLKAPSRVEPAHLVIKRMPSECSGVLLMFRAISVGAKDERFANDLH
jgi:hypothetical protein